MIHKVNDLRNQIISKGYVCFTFSTHDLSILYDLGYLSPPEPELTAKEELELIELVKEYIHDSLINDVDRAQKEIVENRENKKVD